MRPKHTQHPLPSFPVYACAFLTPNEFVLGGGGGASRSGIKNKLRLYSVNDSRAIELKDEYELEKGEDAPMSMAAHQETGTIVCGVNSVQEKLDKGENDNCRAFSIKDNKIRPTSTRSTLPGAGKSDDYQKVTVLSPSGSILAVAGSNDLHLLSFPSLESIAEPIHTEREIYDVAFINDAVILATTHNLFVYTLPDSVSSTTTATDTPSSPRPPKKKSKLNPNGGTQKLPTLELKTRVDLPDSTAEGSSFRAIRCHPNDESAVYTAINAVTPRSKKSKGPSRQAFVVKWNTKTWTVEKTRKVGDRGLTCFDISADGRFLAFGSSDLSVGMLDARTLSPLVSILKAFEFPPTFVKFNPTTSLLVSGSADNSLRVVTIPQEVAGTSFAFVLFMLLAVVFLLLAIATKQYGVKLL
ncbi:WD40-repeat-containing domain protein [Crepidotus variabilis]|uniref:WD40-repeat-containing domain protein n=1 Tax=Crepidotus variabilis TaxID=179855 RepID=A0A9P6JWH1_9AGAR|nr:WD40-repeat-containing domain protein [Crepidotus variabilis]